jgi:hypothetical protein
MNAPRNNKSNPAARVGALIVVIVALAIAVLLYNAIKGKREYDRENAADTPSASAPVAEAASAALAASVTSGASQ